MTFQEYYDYMGWTTDVEWALGLTEEELLALPDFPYHEAKNIRLAHHHLRPRTEEEKEVRRKAQEAWDKEHPHYNHYPTFITILRTGEQYQVPDQRHAYFFCDARGLTQEDVKIVQSNVAGEREWRYRRSKFEPWGDGDNWPEFPVDGDWLADGDEFLDEEIEPRRVFMSDKETGDPILLGSSNNEIFAFRGIGKSVVNNNLIRLLIHGGEWLRFKSTGGLRCLLVDAELPKVQLQERLQEFTGESRGKLKIISPELMRNPKEFPVLSKESDQRRFLRHIETFRPDVIVFDTLTRIFKFDTNDPDAWTVVNDFLLDLRFRGYCTLLIHHAGKNNTQRGLTMGDDNLDISAQLEAPYGWAPGDGLAFKWVYTKTRHGGNLPGFEAKYVDGKWSVSDDELMEVVKLAKSGLKQRAIGESLGMSQATIFRLLKKAAKTGLFDPNQPVKTAQTAFEEWRAGKASFDATEAANYFNVSPAKVKGWMRGKGWKLKGGVWAQS
jgi:AAA domain